MEDVKYTRQKQLIVDAALEHFAKYGFDASNVRDISKRANCSTTVLYKYFKDKKALFLEVYLLCVRTFAEIPNSLSNEEKNPLLRFREFGNAMLRFVLFEHKNMYTFLFGQLGRHLELVSQMSEALLDAVINVFKSLQNLLEECREAGYTLPTDSFTTALMAWVFIDGMAHLYEGDTLLFGVEEILKSKVDSTSNNNKGLRTESMLSIFGLCLLNVFHDSNYKNRKE